MTSSVSGRRYQISVALPHGYTKEHPPYPVLNAADANAEFGTVVETARLLSFSKEIPDLVIVGVGYPNRGQGFKASNAERTLDFTPTADPAWVRESVKDSLAQGVCRDSPPIRAGCHHDRFSRARHTATPAAGHLSVHVQLWFSGMRLPESGCHAAKYPREPLFTQAPGYFTLYTPVRTLC